MANQNSSIGFSKLDAILNKLDTIISSLSGLSNLRARKLEVPFTEMNTTSSDYDSDVSDLEVGKSFRVYIDNSDSGFDFDAVVPTGQVWVADLNNPIARNGGDIIATVSAGDTGFVDIQRVE